MLSTAECYTFEIFDAYADGICCGFGLGSYELTTDDGTVIFSGGEFGASEATNIVVSALSVDEFFFNNIGIYPNPTNDVLNIKLSNNDLPDSYSIYTILGQLINQRKINSLSDLSINTSNLSNGMYFIKILKEGNTVSLPFVKE